jgi:hypothetical protein
MKFLPFFFIGTNRMDGYIAGIASGIAQTFVGHPLDTIKTWAQNKGNGIRQPAYTFANLWKGVQYPLIQAPIICGISFGLYENILQETNNAVVSAGTSGFLRTFAVTPLEYYKIQKQQQLVPRFRHCFRNMGAVISKEFPSACVYFPSYRFLKHHDVSVPLAGGVAGMLAWGSIYPLDTIKTRLQSGMASSIRHAWNIGGLWKGIGACLVRAFITNSVGFYVYEYSLCTLKGDEEPQ